MKPRLVVMNIISGFRGTVPYLLGHLVNNKNKMKTELQEIVLVY